MRKYLINGIGIWKFFPLNNEVKFLNKKSQCKLKRSTGRINHEHEIEKIAKSENIIWKNNNFEKRHLKCSNDMFEFKSSCIL